jgi:hypothetical protein
LVKIGRGDLCEEDTDRGGGLTEPDLPPIAVTYGRLMVDRDKTLY